MSAINKLESLLTFKPREPGQELQPGDVVKLEDGSIRLIGHVNPQRGLCECCTDFFESDIVGVASIFDLYFCSQCFEWKHAICTNHLDT